MDATALGYISFLLFFCFAFFFYFALHFCTQFPITAYADNMIEEVKNRNDGSVPFYVNATSGTTVLAQFDDLVCYVLISKWREYEFKSVK